MFAKRASVSLFFETRGSGRVKVFRMEENSWLVDFRKFVDVGSVMPGEMIGAQLVFLLTYLYSHSYGFFSFHTVDVIYGVHEIFDAMQIGGMKHRRLYCALGYKFHHDDAYFFIV